MDALWIIVGLELVVWAFYTLLEPPQKHKDVSFLPIKRRLLIEHLAVAERLTPPMWSVQQCVGESGNFVYILLLRFVTVSKFLPK